MLAPRNGKNDIITIASPQRIAPEIPNRKNPIAPSDPLNDRDEKLAENEGFRIFSEFFEEDLAVFITEREILPECFCNTF